MPERWLCASDALSDGGDGLRFSIERHGTAEAAFAVRFRGKVYAYFNRCAHVPVELDWQQGQFFDHSGLYLICAVHGALYAPESGRCLGGRCHGKRLESIALVERDGHVYLEE